MKRAMCTRRARRLARARWAGWRRRPHAQKVVKIGDLGSKVGVFEGYGKYQTMAIQMAVEELNAKGGVLGHKIEVDLRGRRDQARPRRAQGREADPPGRRQAPRRRRLQRRHAGGDGRHQEAQDHPLELGLVRRVHAHDEVPQVLLLEPAGLAHAGERPREVHRRQDGQEGLHLLHRLRDGPVRRPPVQDGAREARRRRGRRGRRAARHQGLQPLVRRHQPVEPRRALPGLRRHRLAPPDDPAPLLRHDQEVQAGGHRLLPPAAGSARRSPSRWRASSSSPTTRRTTPTRTCRPSTPSSRRSSASTPTSWPAPTTRSCSGRRPSRR